MKIKFYLNCILYILFSFSFLYAFQLDDLLTTPAKELKQEKIAGKTFLQLSYPKELICYDRKQTIFGFPINEAVLRFSSQKIFESADIILGYSRGSENANMILEKENQISKAIHSHFPQNPIRSSYTFPNNRTVFIKKWQNNLVRVYIFFLISNKKNPSKFSFVSLRIEASAIPERSFEQILKLKNTTRYTKESVGEKLLLVPMRSQLPGTAGCWFTSTARQLNYFGSEIHSICTTISLVGHANRHHIKTGKIMGYKHKNIHINSRPIVEKSCITFIERYNKIAETRNKKLIKMKNSTRWNDNMDKIEKEIVKEMNFDFIDQKQYAFFRKTIINYIDSKIPLGWFVVRCKGGAHHRLIIGYNKIQDIVYYSDSWSPKREIKKMPFLSVYLMTRRFEIFEP